MENLFIYNVGKLRKRKTNEIKQGEMQGFTAPPSTQMANDTPVSVVENKQEDDMIKFEDGSFRQKSNGSFEYRFYNTPCKIQSVYGWSKKECFEKRAKLLMGAQPTKKKKKDKLFGEWLDTWFKTYKEGKVGDAHAKTMLFQIERKIKPKLGSHTLKSLNGLILQEFFNEFSETPNTQKKLKAIIFPCLEKARKLGEIKLNPCEDVELQEHDAEHYRCLSFEEQNAVLSGTTDKYRGFIKFLLCTGIRKTKALELDVSAIDWDNHLITVVKKQKKGKKQTYAVPFLDDLFEGVDVPKEGQLFPDINDSSFSSHYARLMDKLKIADATVHSLRHSFVSTLYNVGMPIKRIQHISGHNKFEMTADVYCHLMGKGSSSVRDYLERLNASLN